jgi:hypothetical protein
MNQFGMQYTCAWKQHKESPCIPIFISNLQKHHVYHIFFYVFSSTKFDNKRAEQVMPRGGMWKWGEMWHK